MYRSYEVDSVGILTHHSKQCLTALSINCDSLSVLDTILEIDKLKASLMKLRDQIELLQELDEGV